MTDFITVSEHKDWLLGSERACPFIPDFHKAARTDKIAPAGFCPAIANRTEKGVKTCILTTYAV